MKLFTILLMFLAHAALAADIPTATTAGQTGYASELEAATAALKGITDPVREWGGGIVLAGDGLFYPTNAVSIASEDRLDMKLAFRGTLVAIYHTHPGEQSTRANGFSDADKRIADGLHVASYIRAIAGDAIYRRGLRGEVTQLSGPEHCGRAKINCAVYYAALEHAQRRALGVEQ